MIVPCTLTLTRTRFVVVFFLMESAAVKEKRSLRFKPQGQKRHYNKYEKRGRTASSERKHLHTVKNLKR